MTKPKLRAADIEKIIAGQWKPGLTWFDLDEEGGIFGVRVSDRRGKAAYVVQGRINGVQRRIPIGSVISFGLDPAAAKDRARDVIRRMKLGENPLPRKRKVVRAAATEGRDVRKAIDRDVTLERALDEYIRIRMESVNERTAAYYRAKLNRHSGDWMTLPLRDITKAMVKDRFLDIRAKLNKKLRASTNGGVTANMWATVLFAVYRAMEGDDSLQLPPNPVDILTRLNMRFKEKARDRMLRFDVDEGVNDFKPFYRAVMALPNGNQRDLILLAMFSGLRRTEGGSLRWGDIDMAARVIRIPADRTKSKRALILPMSDFLVELFQRRRQAAREGAEYVFASYGERGYTLAEHATFQEIGTATGIRISAHDLRRTFASVASALDLSPYKVKALLNHATGQRDDVTAHHYTRFSTADLRAAMQAITDAIKSRCGIASGPVAVENAA